VPPGGRGRASPRGLAAQEKEKELENAAAQWRVKELEWREKEYKCMHVRSLGRMAVPA
jgi:hypothetical protein